ncbi:MAG TPA: PD-(D/E)XK nuclease family protein [Nitrososphaerales archaeon]|nr:PD-(D/E)XK nuclease family protein [Nitrososphaerales archaeon]
MSDLWGQIWKKEQDFYESGTEEFRHHTSFVPVSSIAEQYYCEYKLENQFALGEVPTEAKDTGTALHAELMPTEKITKGEFAKLVGRKEPSVAMLPVWGLAGGLKVIGEPDHIIWSEERPLWVVELKTTKGNPTPLWEDQENQVRIYGLLLDRMGFDCSRMRLAVVRLKSDELTEEEKSEWTLRVSTALLEEKVQALERRFPGKMKVHLLQHEVEKAEKVVASKAGYWLEQREPTSSSSVGKCRACEYNESCPKSLSAGSRT